MNVAIVGYGKMGKEIARICAQRKHRVLAIVDPHAQDATHHEITAEALDGADAVFEFTSPRAAVRNIEAICALKKNVVVGTTGWLSDLKKVEAAVSRGGAALIYGSNYSPGVHLFYNVVERAAQLADALPGYDVYGLELHHAGKADSPSGTAKSIADILLANITRKKRAVFEKLDRAPQSDELHFASVRAGSIPGTHIVGLESAEDSIELRHTAKSRAGFALGAVMAAEWLAGRKGMFTVSDFMNEQLRVRQ